MAHMYDAGCSSAQFGKVMDCPFPVKGVSFMTPSFTIPPLFVLTTVLGVYGVVVYCSIVVRWEPGVIQDPITVSLGSGGGSDLI